MDIYGKIVGICPSDIKQSTAVATERTTTTMRLLSLATTVLMVLVAVLTANNDVHGFRAISFHIKTTQLTSSSLSMSDKSYLEQLNAYNEWQRQQKHESRPTSPMNGAVVAHTTPAVSDFVPHQQQAAATPMTSSPAPLIYTERYVPSQASMVVAAPPPEKSKQQGGNSIIAATAAAFVGLPLWIFLGSQFFNPPAPKTVFDMQLPFTTTTTVNTPPSDAKVGAVVVLSQPITKTQVRELFDLWNDALRTGDPALVANRYAKDGVLLPTLSDIPRNDHDAIQDYFVGFLKKKPAGKILEGEIYIGNNWAQDAGVYEFTFDDGSKVKARYSFVYAFEDGNWMISHHHSSLMPEEVVRPTPITEEQVRGLFDLWNDALATGDPAQVAARYASDAVLLPTLSDSARYTNDRIADYFVGFLKKKPVGKIPEGNIKIGAN